MKCSKVLKDNRNDIENTIFWMASYADGLWEDVANKLGEDDPCTKLAEKCSQKLWDLGISMSEKPLSSEKAASKIAKILSSTVCKIDRVASISDDVNQYLATVTDVNEFVVGNKVTDDEYELLDDIHAIDHEGVDSGVITTVIRNAYKIPYIEDDEQYYCLIGGMVIVAK